jgi:hypothetical protein
MTHDYTVQFKHEHRKTGTEGRTLNVQGSSIQVAIAKATREFVKSLDRKERFDAQKGLNITAARVHGAEEGAHGPQGNAGEAKAAAASPELDAD